MDFPYIFSKRGRSVAVTQNWEETEVYTVWDFTLCVQSDQEMLRQLAYSKSKQKTPDAMSGYSSQLSPISQLNHSLWRNKNQPWSFCFISQKMKAEMQVYLALLTSICQHFSRFCIRTFDMETVLCTLQSKADLNGAWKSTFCCGILKSGMQKANMKYTIRAGSTALVVPFIPKGSWQTAYTLTNAPLARECGRRLTAWQRQRTI